MKRFGKWTVGGLAVGVVVCVGCQSLEKKRCPPGVRPRLP